ncbi:General transcription factor 3C polypeptide 6, variant 2 [Entomophthora muscae]|uniref:General transcription factor 3C polypeptide 6, variant 2 n=2 Tax=Entomophthora muscae TaxID=34485 RepID=A0ACC2SD80_9FUNG|nr:General transcription factor 3C polypeptide 6, variant 2 [Entomophthora muscae]
MDNHSSDEYEEFEESTYVIMDFDIKDWDSAPKAGQKYSIIGFDSEETFFQSDGNTFRGEYHNSCGTDIIFDTIPDSDGDTLVPLTTTFKKLKFASIKLEGKNKEDTPYKAGLEEEKKSPSQK